MNFYVSIIKRMAYVCINGWVRYIKGVFANGKFYLEKISGFIIPEVVVGLWDWNYVHTGGTETMGTIG
jgi:hypothetical protein